MKHLFTLLAGASVLSAIVAALSFVATNISTGAAITWFVMSLVFCLGFAMVANKQE